MPRHQYQGVCYYRQMPETRKKPGIRAKMLEIKAYVYRDQAENVSNQSKCGQRKGEKMLEINTNVYKDQDQW